MTDCLREVKEKTESEYVVADRNGQPLSSSQFQRVWKYVTVRSTKPHNYYKYVNGQCVKCTVTPTPGSHQKNNPKLVYAIDFDVTPHQLRHTYITNLLYAGVDQLIDPVLLTGGHLPAIYPQRHAAFFAQVPQDGLRFGAGGIFPQCPDAAVGIAEDVVINWTEPAAARTPA